MRLKLYFAFHRDFKKSNILKRTLRQDRLKTFCE